MTTQAAERLPLKLSGDSCGKIDFGSLYELSASNHAGDNRGTSRINSA